MSFISNDELTLTIKEIREKLQKKWGYTDRVEEVVEEIIVDAQKKTCCKED